MFSNCAVVNESITHMAGGWFACELPEPRTVVAYKITPQHFWRGPISWSLEAFGDDAWEVIDSRVVDARYWYVTEGMAFKIKTPVPRAKYRLIVANVAGDNRLGIRELRFYGIAKPDDDFATFELSKSGGMSAVKIRP